MSKNGKPEILEVRGRDLDHPKPEMTYRVVIHDKGDGDLELHAQGAIIGDLYQQYVSSHEARLLVTRERLQEYADVFAALARQESAD